MNHSPLPLRAANLVRLYPAPALSVPAPELATENRTNTAAPATRTPRRPLTDRERQIVRLLCDGLTNAGIGQRLGIAAETVKSELKRIFRKLEAKNRTQAAVLLVRQEGMS